ncbi:MAG: hypothetical protein LH470_11725, partial [Lysobacter sp.]|nr:hypothetical protein [Lysobacter sp.]
MTAWTTLVQAEELAAQIGNAGIVIVDCRFALGDPVQGENAYRNAHIPAALYAHLDRDLSDHGKQNQGSQTQGRQNQGRQNQGRQTLRRQTDGRVRCRDQTYITLRHGTLSYKDLTL